jgi:organic hydroperoxide reductase OsmC/OhrA
LQAACFAMALGSILAAQEAERRCPASRALQGNVAIGVHATLEGPPTSSSGIGAA